MKELQNLIDAAGEAVHKNLKLKTTGNDGEVEAVRSLNRLSLAISAAENAENTALRLAGELADAVSNHVGDEIGLGCSRCAEIAEKARELQKELGG